jgi:hypothetical protein
MAEATETKSTKPAVTPEVIPSPKIKAGTITMTDVAPLAPAEVLLSPRTLAEQKRGKQALQRG